MTAQSAQTTGLNFGRVASGNPAAGAQGNVTPMAGAGAGARSAGRAPRLDANGNPQAETQIYLNITTKLPLQMEDGSVEMTEITLPFGLGIDTMNEAANGGPVLNAAKNAFLTMVKQLGDSLAPGEAVSLDQHTFPLPVEMVLRRKGNAHATGETNPLIAAMQAAVANFVGAKAGAGAAGQ